MKILEKLVGVEELKKIIQDFESKQSTILQDFEKKQSAVDAIIISLTYGSPAKTWEKYEDYVEEGYLKNSTVGDCLDYIARAVGGIDWFSVKKDSGGKEKAVDNSDFTKLINHPNPFVKGKAEFFKELILYLYLSGNEYMQRAPLNTEKVKEQVVKELYNLRPDRMSIVKGTGAERIGGYKYTINSTDKGKDYKADEIMHIKFFNPLDDWYGVTPLKRIEYEIDQTNEAQLWNYNLLRNGGVPQVVLLVKKTLEATDKTAIQKAIKERYGGGKNAGKWAVIDNAGEVEIKTLGLSPLAMQWLDGLYFTKAQIAVTLGVPPELIGDTAHKIFNNYKEARKSFYEDTVLPFMDWQQESLNGFLSPFFNGEELRYDKDDIEALAEARSIKYVDAIAGWNAGLLRRNEARDLMQQSSIKGEDDFKPAPTGFGMLSMNKKMELKTLAGMDITTEEQKDMYWKSQEVERNKWIEIIKPKIQKRLEEEKKEIVEAVKNDKKPEDGIDENKWFETLKDVYITVAIDFAQKQTDKLKSVYSLETKASDKVPKIPFTVDILKYFDKIGMVKVKLIKDTVREICKDELTEGIKLGEGISQLAARIEDKIEEIIPNRATVIARTEVRQSANAGNHFSAAESGLDLIKTWLTTRDGREREWHGAVDGQERDFNDPYDVPNGDGTIEQLMFPLDSSLGASADNIIQCRCGETYKVKGNE